MYSEAELFVSFANIMKKTYLGVNGVAIFDSGKHGPTLGITICTHGNEPSGLAVYQHLIDSNIQSMLLSGRIITCLNNPHATKDFFAATTEEEKRKARFSECNMNRLPLDVATNTSDVRYEAVRTRELLQVWQEFDVAIDIHSTTQETTPMIIVCDSVPTELLRNFPIAVVISNIHNVQIGQPAIALYGKPKAGTPVFGIESGQHTNQSSFNCAIACIQALLQNSKMMNPQLNELLPKMLDMTEYYIDGSLVVPNESYSLTRVFTTYEFIEKGTELALGNQGAITMPRDGHVLFGPNSTTIHDISGEVLFFSRPKIMIVQS